MCNSYVRWGQMGHSQTVQHVPKFLGFPHLTNLLHCCIVIIFVIVVVSLSLSCRHCCCIVVVVIITSLLSLCCCYCCYHHIVVVIVTFVLPFGAHRGAGLRAITCLILHPRDVTKSW